MSATTPEDPAHSRDDAPPRYAHEVMVRYAETDQMGVCHHASFLLYLEDARTAMLRAHGLPYSELERRGVALPVRRIDLRYLTPAFYEDVLLVHVWIEKHRSASMTFGYAIERENEGGGADTVARATVELACIDLASRRPQVFPDELQEFLLAHGG